MNARENSEVLVAVLATVTLVGLEIWLCGAGVAFSQPLWLDEIHTVLVAGRQGLIASMKSLGAGADFNPPALFLIYRGIGTLAGGLSEVTLRAVAFTSVVAAIPLVYALLRDGFERSASAIGALAVWTNSVVVTEAFDARFYGPWLLAAVSLAEVVRRQMRGGPSVLRSVAIAVISIVICTIHYFGFLSWIGVVGTTWIVSDASRRDRIRRLLPAVFGPVALALCLPLYLGQRAALTTATWIPDLSFGGVLFLFVAALLSPSIAAAVIGYVASVLARRRGVGNSDASVDDPFALGPALLLGQVIVPVALGIFSMAVQPAMQPRYTIVAALCGAPIVAAFYSRMLSGFRLLTVCVVGATGIMLVRDAGESARQRVRLHKRDMDQVIAIAARDSTVVVRRRHTLYPVLRDRPELGRWAVLFDQTSTAPNDRFAIVERDVARVHERLYGFPHLVTRADLDRERAFYFLEADSTRAPTRSEFPGRRIERVRGGLFLIQRECDRPQTRESMDSSATRC